MCLHVSILIMAYSSFGILDIRSTAACDLLKRLLFFVYGVRGGSSRTYPHGIVSIWKDGRLGCYGNWDWNLRSELDLRRNWK